MIHIFKGYKSVEMIMFSKTGISLLHVRTLKINTVMPDISRNA